MQLANAESCFVMQHMAVGMLQKVHLWSQCDTNNAGKLVDTCLHLLESRAIFVEM